MRRIITIACLAAGMALFALPASAIGEDNVEPGCADVVNDSTSVTYSFTPGADDRSEVEKLLNLRPAPDSGTGSLDFTIGLREKSCKKFTYTVFVQKDDAIAGNADDSASGTDPVVKSNFQRGNNTKTVRVVVSGITDNDDVVCAWVETTNRDGGLVDRAPNAGCNEHDSDGASGYSYN